LIHLPPSEVEKSKNPIQDFVCLRESDIRALLEGTQKGGKEFDEYRLEDFREMLSR